jgi:hypothetical protein
MIGREVVTFERKGMTWSRAVFLAVVVALATVLGVSGTALSKQASNKDEKLGAQLFDMLNPFTLEMMSIPKRFKTSDERIALASDVKKNGGGGGSPTRVEIPRRPSARSPFVPPSWVPGAKYPNWPSWLPSD